MSSTAERSTARSANAATPLTRDRVLRDRRRARRRRRHRRTDHPSPRRAARRRADVALLPRANKEAILDGIVELVFDEVEQATGGFDVPEADAAWKGALRARILAAREVMLRHPWAPGVMDTRSGLGMTTARYVDSVVGTLRSGGLSYDLIHHSMHALGSRMFGFSQELGATEDGGDAASGDPDELAQMAAQVPHLAEMLSVVRHDDPDSTLGWCDDQFEFEFGLDLVLDGHRTGLAQRVARRRLIGPAHAVTAWRVRRRGAAPPRAPRSRRAPARRRRRPR